MFLLKACPRCSGDIDVTYPEDVYCVQCAHRPQVVYPGPRIVERNPEAKLFREAGDCSAHKKPGDKVLVENGILPLPSNTNSCPRCGAVDSIPLDRLREEDNICYRCRSCGHIFSPVSVGAGEGRGVM